MCKWREFLMWAFDVPPGRACKCFIKRLQARNVLVDARGKAVLQEYAKQVGEWRGE